MPTSSAFVLRIMFSKSQNIRCIFHKESAVESSEKCFISCLCCARCAGMWCFASSRNHRDIRSRLCGGIVTSVWRRCCCLRDPLQSILNNSFRLHFSLKLQFCVSLFVSSPKEEPEKDEKRIKGRLFLSSLTQIRAEILAMSQNQIRAWISHPS